jgi:hypothetical protein
MGLFGTTKQLAEKVISFVLEAPLQNQELRACPRQQGK